MKGFFPSQAITKRVTIPLVPRCGECQLYKHCLSPKMGVSGRGDKKILILGESPGKEEDRQGRPFVGDSGQFLEAALRKSGVSLRQDCWIYNSVICRPKDNLLPKKAITYCRPNVIKVVEELKPETIIVLGKSAVQSLIGWLWKEDVGSMERWAGWIIPCVKLNAWIAPTYHPAHLLRNNDRGRKQDVTTNIFHRHVRRALKLSGRPWDALPDYESQVRKIIDPDAAGRRIRKFIEAGKPVAFDYETQTVKPDGPNAEIVCCAVSDGNVSVAYPWHGDAITATGELLRSEIFKIGWSVKFEERWTLSQFGFKVRNWLWDGMLAAHTLDNRKGTKSLKFQSFILLGQQSYDDEVKPYFETDGSHTKNRVKQIPLDKLLLYCGLDSLLEFKIAEIQMQEMGL